MRTATEYLETVKKRHNLRSDYALAKFLGISRQAVSKQKHGGGLDDYTALKVAQALDINPLEIIAARNQERAKSAEEKAAWEKILKSVAACTVGVFLLLLPTKAPESSTSGINQIKDHGIYIIRTLRRARKLLKRFKSWTDTLRPSTPQSRFKPFRSL